MKLVLTLTLLFFSFQTFANPTRDLLEKKLAEKGSQTPYQILADFFSTDGSAVSTDDLNSINLDSGLLTSNFQKCVMANQTSVEPQEMNLTVFGQTKIIPAVPPHGPLFPGSPEIKLFQSSLATSLQGITSVGSDYLNRVLDSSNWNSEAVGKTIFSNEGSSNLGFSYAEIKSHAAMISFYLNSKSDGSIYGYCWNE